MVVAQRLVREKRCVTTLIRAGKETIRQCMWLTKLLFSLFLAANDILKDSEPGSFIIRDSQSFPGAFGLAVKVAVPPAHVLQGLQGDLSKFYISIAL